MHVEYVGMSRRTASSTRASIPTLVETKLHPSRARPELVIRPRLLDRMEQLSPAALTLVAAPVGFGKTMLVESWCARTDTAVAWVSLDPGDNDPVRLWTYLSTAVDRVRSGLGRSALARLRSPQPPREPAVDELINALHAYGEPLALVLDDLHVITDDTCMRSLEHFVEHLPPRARVVVTTRSDPPLALGRLRARGSLGEIRAHELAFTVDEARQLLVTREGLPLDDDDVELLVERTEGWPAGLYLAALWLRELDDRKAGIRAFHGGHRHVAEYLGGEVLDALDGDTRRLLVETSIFSTFDPAMCDAVLRRSDSARRLRELEQANSFLIALDPQGDSYRYHHLFHELLQLELATREPSAPARLHGRASKWFLENGRVEEAIEHAAAAKDLERVVAILVAEHRELLRSGRLSTVLRWCTFLPEELLLDHPELPLAGALAAALGRGPAHARHRFGALAERARSERSEQWAPYHETVLGILRTAWIEGDVEGTVQLARRTIDFARAVPESAVPALASLGYALFLAGEPDEAYARAREAVDRPEAPARPHGLVLALATLSLLESDSGHAEAAEALARDAVSTATGAGVDKTASGGSARVALAAALAAQGRLREAEHEAVEGERCRRQTEHEGGHLHALLVLAGIRARRGRIDRAAADLESARRGLETFTDAGRLPQLVSAIERTLEKAQAAASLVSETPSDAELNVLRLLATDLSQREIADRLYLSLNTVKTHARALYRKLEATSREEAVERATALGLLDSNDSPG